MESGVLAEVLDQGEIVLPKHIQVSGGGAVGAVTTQSELSSFVRKINTSVLKYVKCLWRKLPPGCLLSPNTRKLTTIAVLLTSLVPRLGSAVAYSGQSVPGRESGSLLWFCRPP